MLVVAAVCGYVLITLPRTAVPDQLPALRISEAAAREVFEEDHSLAQQASNSPDALELDSLLQQQGDAERKGTEAEDTQNRRREVTHRTAALVASAEGMAALIKLRARAVEQLQAALSFELPKEHAQRVLAGFASVLRDTMATRGGVLIAPRLVVRTLYKVRWNVIVGLPLLHELRPAELLAYNGWFALHVSGGQLPVHLEILRAYETGGGFYANEARGVLDYMSGEPTGARRAFEIAAQARPSFRLDNWIRSAKRAEFTVRGGAFPEAVPGD